MKPLVPILEAKLKRAVVFLDDCVGADVEAACAGWADDDVPAAAASKQPHSPPPPTHLSQTPHLEPFSCSKTSVFTSRKKAKALRRTVQPSKLPKSQSLPFVHRSPSLATCAFLPSLGVLLSHSVQIHQRRVWHCPPRALQHGGGQPQRSRCGVLDEERNR